MCWYCGATLDNFHRNVAHAELSHSEFVQRCVEQEIALSELFSAPEVDRDSVAIDWLHTVELGVAQDLLGHVFWEAVNCAELWPRDCSNRALRVRALNGRLQGYYGRAKPQNRVGKLTLKMFKKERKQPKLSSKAAECRALQPFAKELARSLFEARGGDHEWDVLEAIDALMACSQVVDTRPFDIHEFQRLGQATLDALHRLQDGADEFWQLKPKHHLFKHLLYNTAPMHGSPCEYWTFMDESLGGVLAKISLHRGGASNASVINYKLMARVAALGLCK